MSEREIYQATVEEELLFLEVRQISENIKQLEKRKKMLVTRLEDLVGDREDFVDQDGMDLATWRWTAPTKFFDSKSFKDKHPKMYKSFMAMRAGSRRLVFK